MNRTSEAGRIRQTGILFHRDFELFFNDKKRVGITLILPIVIGLVITIVADEKDMGKIYESTRATMFTIICAGIYVGMFNSLPLICKERHIIKREYMTGMRISSYITAMTIFQAIISMVQTLIFMVIYWGPFGMDGIGLPEHDILTGSSFLDYTISLFLIMFAADMMGMLISAIVRSNELANLIAPIIIIFQLVMSGVLFQLSGIMDKVAALTVSKWGMQAIGAIGHLKGMKTTAEDSLSKKILDMMSEKKKHDITNPDGMEAYKASAENLGEAWIWMAAFIIVLAVLCIIFLKRVEKDAR